VQDLLSQQLDAADNEAVMAELQQLEDAFLQEEVEAMPNVPVSEQQQQQQDELPEEDLPSVPQTQVSNCVLPSLSVMKLSLARYTDASKETPLDWDVSSATFCTCFASMTVSPKGIVQPACLAD
jgi:hypothetical protein